MTMIERAAPTPHRAPQRSYHRLGAHVAARDGVAGVRFAVWAPNASRVSVIGSFNGWDDGRDVMRNDGRNGGDTGVWDVFVPHAAPGDLYKFALWSRDGVRLPDKADPHARSMQRPPETASIVAAPSGFAWSDRDWMARRGETCRRDRPISIYEMHLGSWRRSEDGRQLDYREIADRLVPYVSDLGFTHIELLPVSEHPFEGSWGYQPVGLYAPTSRLGSADDLRLLIDRCHAAGIGVILDWAAGHFPDDAHGLAHFDGTHLYEHADPRQGRHADWGSLIYNLGRTEVVEFLIDNAHYWLEEFHVDGLRVDAVASMLYLDYSRAPGQWVPNMHGGNENLEAIAFLRRLNSDVYGQHPGVFTIAEESTAWPAVSAPVHHGGLGFGYKWNMGWMNDTLRYIGLDPVHRKHHHDQLTFPLMYAFAENFVLPLSHDEVVHGKRSLIGRMPGDDWQRFANYRAYLAYMFTHPGKKLLFMGAEFAQEREWSHMRELDWHLLAEPRHAGLHALVGDLNRIYRDVPALHAGDCVGAGFSWIACDDREQSVLSYLRRVPDGDASESVLVICNLTPVPRRTYRVGVPVPGGWATILDTDAARYGGSAFGDAAVVASEPRPSHGHAHSLSLSLPPLATIVLAPRGAAPVASATESTSSGRDV